MTKARPLLTAVVLVGLAVACSASGPPAPSASSSPDEFTALRRPLQLPHVDSGQACPRSDWKAFTDLQGPAELGTTGYIVLGSGPAYPIVYNFDSATGSVKFSDFVGQAFYPESGPVPSTNPGMNPRWNKVRWVVAPTYTGPLLVRGGRLDSTGTVIFPEVDHSGEIRIATDPSVNRPDSSVNGWRDHPGAINVDGPGCYGLQVDGMSFTQIVVLEVRP